MAVKMPCRHQEISPTIIFCGKGLQTLIFLSILILFLSSGCLATRFASLRDELVKDHFSGHYIPVSFIPQEKHRCGPAVLAMELAYWGENVSEGEIVESIYLPGARGTLTFDLESYPEKFGLWARSYQGKLSDLKDKLDRDIPVIVLIGTGPFFFRGYHYALLIGYWDRQDVVIMHSGKKKDCLMKCEAFLERWKAADFWTLLICPPEKINWPLTKEESLDLARFYFIIANKDLEKNLFQKAALGYQKAISLNPEFADAYNNLAWVYFKQKKNLDEAVNLVQKALQLNPGHKTYYLDTLRKLHSHSE